MAYVEYYTRSGTAADGEDYTGQSGFLQFVGETNLTIAIPLFNDALPEGEEMLWITLWNPDPFDTQLGPLSEVPLRIQDNDRRIEFSSYEYLLNENSGSVTITLQRAGEPAMESVWVDCLTTDGSATPAIDFLPVSEFLEFAPGETNKTVTIPILNDALVEGYETVILVVSGPDESLGLVRSAVVTILDNDRGVEFGSSFTSVNER